MIGRTAARAGALLSATIIAVAGCVGSGSASGQVSGRGAGTTPASHSSTRGAPLVAAGASVVAAGAAEPSSPPAAPMASGVRPGSVNATSMNLSAIYSATVRLGFSSRAFAVDEAIIATNTSGVAIDRLELNTIVARLGSMTITGASVDGATAHPTVTDQTIHLPLGGILDPGATTLVRLQYRATLRSTTSGSTWLFTRANGILEAHRWLPWISVPTPFDRPNYGDPFVTGVSPSVRVRLLSDRTLRYATTGEHLEGFGTNQLFEATNARDFAFTAAPDYSVHSTTAGPVTIRPYSRPGFPVATVLSAARTALSREAALLGAYPYPSYDLAQTAGGYGMESPGLTWIPTGAGSLAYLVAHETGHQWFYGIVGDDQARQPFDDEAAADFVARYVLGLRRASRCSTARLDLTIYQYSGACYYEDIYIQGGNLLDDTRLKMGSTAFWAAIRDYLATYRFRIATTQALLATLDRHTPLDLAAWRFRARFPSLY
ncbi:MAG TPA: hypothetical protein VFP22_03390 [Candidatus Limnocylindrales bacterium]|nr:hypothetical protein [Candidatus Limnocylindrales bacterium]